MLWDLKLMKLVENDTLKADPTVDLPASTGSSPYRATSLAAPFTSR